MVKSRWILVAAIAGLVAGAMLLYVLLYRPASERIKELRQRAERLDSQLADAFAEYQRASGEFGKRIQDLEGALRRERAAGERVTARAISAEARAGSLANILRGISEASGVLEGIPGRIREEADAGIGDLESLSRLLEGGR